ncbi:MAG: zf-HC2 domain-containing protein [Verrucomicrobiota bacterium]
MSILQKIVFRIIECREAMEKSSRYVDGELSLWDRFRLKLHFNQCWCCNRFVKQLPLLGTLARQLHESDHLAPHETLPPDARERIKKILSQSSSNEHGSP